MFKFYLKFVTDKSDSFIKIEANLIDSSNVIIRENREYLNQIIQYIKNNLNNDDKTI
jgi:hypothetical protein